MLQSEQKKRKKIKQDESNNWILENTNSISKNEDRANASFVAKKRLVNHTAIIIAKISIEQKNKCTQVDFNYLFYFKCEREARATVLDRL